jgi:UMF1 family MFS transporter
VGEDTTAREDPASGRERFAWCLFDFANSAFPTIALTAFGGIYFVRVLAGPEGVDLGFATFGPAAAWGLSLSVSMALVTVTSPIMGAIADRSGRKRFLLGAYVVICVAATAGLGLVPPGHGLLALLLYVVANFAFEGGYVFYNSFLPELTTPDRVGRLSGYGWALGYVGGLLALVCCLPLTPSEYTAEQAGAASSIYFVVAGWYFVFSIPSLLWLRDRARPERPPGGFVRAGFREMRGLVRLLRSHRVILVFLAAYFLYNDGIITVIEFVSVFTSEVLGFTPGDNIVLFLVLNVIAAPGALFFGSLLDRVGGRRTIRITLVLWIVVVAGAALVATKAQFWAVAVLAAVVIGATQSSSRALMARLAPRERMGELMGALALSGKASAIFGPALYGAVAEAAERPEALSEAAR